MNITILAVFFHLSFTAPDSGLKVVHVTPDSAYAYAAIADRYEFRRRNARFGPQPANAYSNPVTLAVLQPQPAGRMVDAFVSCTADPNNAFGWRNGGQAIDMRACLGDSCAPWSNITIHATAMPDTNVTTNLRDWQRTVGGIARFNREPGDTALTVAGIPGPIAVQEAVQVATRPALCSSFHVWCLRGAPQPCP